MATTRIMPLHIGKGRTESTAISDIIDYVANPQKTDNGRLVTGYECDSRIADTEFVMAKRQYKTREIYVAYRQAGYSKKFRQEHEAEILLHQAAKNAFDDMGVKKLPKVKELQTEYAKLLEEKKKIYAEYRRSREEMRELLTAKANVDRLLKMDEEQKQEKEKDHDQR